MLLELSRANSQARGYTEHMPRPQADAGSRVQPKCKGPPTLSGTAGRRVIPEQSNEGAACGWIDLVVVPQRHAEPEQLLHSPGSRPYAVAERAYEAPNSNRSSYVTLKDIELLRGSSLLPCRLGGVYQAVAILYKGQVEPGGQPITLPASNMCC